MAVEVQHPPIFHAPEECGEGSDDDREWGEEVTGAAQSHHRVFHVGFVRVLDHAHHRPDAFGRQHEE